MKDSYDVIVVGSGAAGFSTADWLVSRGINDICIMTENVNSGTSRNAGSDKQTYYKLDVSSDAGDSVMKMAEDLFRGGAMNGTDALTEAAYSLRCFMRLAEAGVPFPTDPYGRYVGYRTDHDNTCRATSAGPLTSKLMTEKLQEKVERDGVEILDGHTVIKLIAERNCCGGVICLHDGKMKAIRAKAVILCTGAPAAMYSRSVYPESQRGATGLAIEAGAELANFQEWQYGIASVGFRWNLSGSYQQVVPRYYSVDEDGNEYEFLASSGDKDIYTKVFLKGYQWPFSAEKTEGSSGVDMLIFRELEKGRRVFLDYTRDPEGFDFDALSDEAKDYLNAAECTGNTPYERLMQLNPKAVKLYADHGIDLSSVPLEISLSAQHNNGGIRTDGNSETSVKRLFAVGEAAGKFGCARPGGSALNDTQVGGLRAAEYLARVLGELTVPEIEIKYPEKPYLSGNANLTRLEEGLTLMMSDCAGMFREYEKLNALIPELKNLAQHYHETVSIPDFSFIEEYYIFRQTVFSMLALCETELSSIDHAGSRGGCLCFRNGRRVKENKKYRKLVTVTRSTGVFYVPVEPIPKEKYVFEQLLKEG